MMPPMAHAARIAGLPCFRCGYDLAGLEETAPCPECAANAITARAGAALIHADPASLSRLSQSARLWGWLAIVGGVVATIDDARYRLEETLFQRVVSHFDMTYGVFLSDAAVTIYVACIVIASMMLVQRRSIHGIRHLVPFRVAVWLSIAWCLLSFASELGAPREYFTGAIPTSSLHARDYFWWWFAILQELVDTHLLQIAVCLLLSRIAAIMGVRRIAKILAILPLLSLVMGVASQASNFWLMSVGTYPPQAIWILDECSSAIPLLSTGVGAAVVLLARQIRRRAARACDRPSAASPAPERDG